MYITSNSKKSKMPSRAYIPTNQFHNCIPGNAFRSLPVCQQKNARKILLLLSQMPRPINNQLESVRFHITHLFKLVNIAIERTKRAKTLLATISIPASEIAARRMGVQNYKVHEWDVIVFGFSSPFCPFTFPGGLSALIVAGASVNYGTFVGESCYNGLQIWLFSLWRLWDMSKLTFRSHSRILKRNVHLQWKLKQKLDRLPQVLLLDTMGRPVI